MVVGVAGTVGFDVMVPGDLPIRPYLGNGVGGAWVGTITPSEASQLLLDPNQNELDNTSNVDPIRDNSLVGQNCIWVQKTSVTDFSSSNSGTDGLLGRISPKETPEAIKAQREAYGWNALDLSLGLGFSF